MTPNRPPEADMPLLWERVAERMADPSDDFYLARGPWGPSVGFRFEDGTFTLHFPRDWQSRNIAEVVKQLADRPRTAGDAAKALG